MTDHMEEIKALMDYAMPSTNRATSSIRRSAIQANHFEIKLVIIQMIQQTVQFDELSQEDPKVHIVKFLKICDTFKHNEVIEAKTILIRTQRQGQDLT